MESATENNRRAFWSRVRVKMCGKSTQLGIVIYEAGKPRLEQDKEVYAVVRSAHHLLHREKGRIKYTGMSLR